MAVTMTGTYVGGLKTEIEHGPSGTKLRTAAPVDNQGDGSSFSPTDLVGAALASCMLTTMAIVGTRHGIDLEGSTFRVEKHMRSDPRRIDRLPVELHLPAALTAEQRTLMERTAHACPVHHSLLSDIDKSITFVYDK
jgi:uncharacterized OsmC-like protein